MELVARLKRSMVDALPGGLATYLRTERPVWERQWRRARRAAEGAAGATAFRSALARPVDPELVVWESFGGNGALCNPLAIFNELISRPEHRHLRHIWVVRSRGDSAPDPLDKGVRVATVVQGSRAYYRALETARYLVNNSTFPATFIKRDGQTYLNTWHGTPLKTMGYDAPGGAQESRNILRNMLSADWLLSQSPTMTDRMYRSGYRLEGLLRGRVLELGYPRTDVQHDDGASARLAAELDARGLQVAGRKLLLYAPTWRGESFHSPEAGVALVDEAVGELAGELEPEGWRVLVKPHQAVASLMQEGRHLTGRIVPHEIPVNRLLGLASALVTDYSSVFVDYLASDRPVLFHIPDLHTYSTSRGLYVTPAELPGVVTESAGELRSAARLLAKGTLDGQNPEAMGRRRALAEELNPRDDGSSSSRVVDVVFEGADHPCSLRRESVASRKSILVFLGGLRTNGITSSALNLINALDADLYDVTVLYYRSSDGDHRRNVERIPGHVRQIIRDPGRLQPALVASLSAIRRGVGEAAKRPAHEVDRDLWEAEWRRVVGTSVFDAVIDFSGYSPYWTKLLAHSNAERKAVWLHNDLAADAQKVIAGKQPHANKLPEVFKMYAGYDRLVSVSSALARINAENLGSFAPEARFVSARNVVDFQRISEAVGALEGASESGLSISCGSLAEAVAMLSEVYSHDQIIMAAERSRERSLTGDRMVAGKTFITVGRLSPEKNHHRLLEAFRRVHQEDPHTRLVIVGDGVLRGELEAAAHRWRISDAVRFTGQVSNPYPLLAEADCFVLSSDYEGQPVVILEARVVGLPVITTRFGSAESALGRDEGLIVERDVEALADGMRQFLAGGVPSRPFDAAEYTLSALQEFDGAVFG